MDIFPSTREYGKWTIVADTDLTNATADAYVENAWQALSWDAAATVLSNGKWSRVAKLLMRGADAAAGGLLITTNLYPVRTRVTIPSGEVIVRDSSDRITLREAP